MSESKSAGGRMDYWREYFGTANADIFEIIERAIMVAASDCPKEFRIRRDGIAQTLFSCKLVRCSGCDKVELALPGGDDDDDERHDHDDDEIVKCKSELLDVDGYGSKGSSKVISSCRDRDDDDDDDDQMNMNQQHHHHVSNYSYGEAEALTDEIEEENQMFGEVMRIKEIVDNSQDESESVLYNSLRKLQLMALSVETLKATEIGKSVNALRKHASKDVRQIARTLIEVWKEMVDEWVNATTKMTVPEATPESVNPSVLDEEEGLPSPPLDDLAFLNPHTTSLEMSEFFDGVDEDGNPGNNGEFNKNRENGRKPPIERQNVPKLKQQRPLNEPPVAPKVKESGSAVKKQEGLMKKQTAIVKPAKPPVADAAAGRQMKPNMEPKLKNSEKATVPKRSLPSQQCKPRASEETTVQDKLEATKRKLQERYQQAENAKRQRTIQVMELRDLPKQAPIERNQFTRPGNNHNRHWANGRR